MGNSSTSQVGPHCRGDGSGEHWLNDWEVEGVEFTEKSILASPLAAKSLIELGRWNPISLLVLAPVWSYNVSGAADHWWFVARSENKDFYYVAQFCQDEGKNHVSGYVFQGMDAAVSFGRQYEDAQWWHVREWKPCLAPRPKEDLDKLALLNPAVSSPYSWAANNCQHFAIHLYEGDGMHAA